MIRYALKCSKAHRFDAWFGSSGDFDRLKSAGHLACAVCGAAAVDKDMMAPRVAPAGDGASAQASAGTPVSAAPGGPQPSEPLSPRPPGSQPGPLSGPASTAEQALVDLRRRIEAEADNVGREFAAEARRIHAGTSPERPIIGEARPAEARALLEDGIAVSPLPWGPARRSN